VFVSAPARTRTRTSAPRGKARSAAVCVHRVCKRPRKDKDKDKDKRPQRKGSSLYLQKVVVRPLVQHCAGRWSESRIGVYVLRKVRTQTQTYSIVRDLGRSGLATSWLLRESNSPVRRPIVEDLASACFFLLVCSFLVTTDPSFADPDGPLTIESTDDAWERCELASFVDCFVLSA
jgi:hypothetical protein